MALPQLNNDAPRYELTIPSTGNTIKYRPFLVKEQKNLLIALESKDPKNILNSVLLCIESCAEDVNSSKLSTFDVDYVFTQIRGKSVGETSSVVVTCDKCNDEQVVNINLDDININMLDLENNVVEITPDISIKMKYPTYDDMMNNEILFESESKTTEILFETIITCIDSVLTKEDNIIFKDEPREEKERFINSLTNEQLEKMSLFIDSIPSLTHNVDHTCVKCGHQNTTTLQGIQDFF
jgi:hypothetical protein